MRVLVTGASGFVGRAVALECIAAGHALSAGMRRPSSELEAHGARVVRLDLGDAGSIAAAVRDQDAVVHVAALTGVWGRRSAFFETNVEGTRRVLDACRAHGVARLVYTSSPSVCFDGRDQRGVHELAYARHFSCDYARTKAIAERAVLAASGRGGLTTCALRPHLVIGPGDPHLVPRLVARARAGRLSVVGDGANEVSLTWVENAALAHRLAAERLEPGAAHAGRAYFVAQREPVRLWSWIEELLARLGLPGPRRRVPRAVASAAGAALELVWRALALAGEPPMTRFVAAQLSTSHTYDAEPARRDFGYVERVSMAEATERLVAHLRGAG